MRKDRTGGTLIQPSTLFRRLAVEGFLIGFRIGAGTDARIVQMATRLLRRWLLSSNRYFLAPTDEQLAEIRAALEDCQVGLGDEERRQIHLLATEGAVHIDRDHVWHMETLAKVCRADEALLLATPYQVVDGPRHRLVGTTDWQRRRRYGGETVHLPRHRTAQPAAASGEVPGT